MNHGDWYPHQFSQTGENSTPSNKGRLDFDSARVDQDQFFAALLRLSMCPQTQVGLANEPGTFDILFS